MIHTSSADQQSQSPARKVLPPVSTHLQACPQQVRRTLCSLKSPVSLQRGLCCSPLYFLGGNRMLPSPPWFPMRPLEHYLLLICLHTVVKFNHVTPNEPDQIGEVWDSSFVSDVVQHGLVIHWEDSQKKKQWATKIIQGSFTKQNTQTNPNHHEKALLPSVFPGNTWKCWSYSSNKAVLVLFSQLTHSIVIVIIAGGTGEATYQQWARPDYTENAALSKQVSVFTCKANSERGKPEVNNLHDTGIRNRNRHWRKGKNRQQLTGLGTGKVRQQPRGTEPRQEASKPKDTVRRARKNRKHRAVEPTVHSQGCKLRSLPGQQLHSEWSQKAGSANWGVRPA